eukprot:TRINITY_DN29960_c0_g1_i1.p1 TRINITY_DN29960_c0_g1~~TRINITY_DN29960_c0_g1_i1.p1  ORF type:complete len:277 (+),score=41.45 TRINITY_DN29960_c0_g1_i1:26-856(+)
MSGAATVRFVVVPRCTHCGVCEGAPASSDELSRWRRSQNLGNDKVYNTPAIESEVAYTTTKFEPRPLRATSSRTQLSLVAEAWAIRDHIAAAVELTRKLEGKPDAIMALVQAVLEQTTSEESEGKAKEEAEQEAKAAQQPAGLVLGLEAKPNNEDAVYGVVAVAKDKEESGAKHEEAEISRFRPHVDHEPMEEEADEEYRAKKEGTSVGEGRGQADETANTTFAATESPESLESVRTSSHEVTTRLDDEEHLSPEISTGKPVNLWGGEPVVLWGGT